ncbi:MAG: VWA domain-containing protein, partial [Acidobacteriota bacterium]
SSMFRFSPTLAFVLLAAAQAFGQIAPSATPPPAAAADDVVKISTNLIQVDVSVTDSKGKVVRDLRPDEFEIYENGQRQPVSNFSFISSLRETPLPEKTAGKPQPAIPSAPVRVENVRRTIALVVDDLSLSFESTYFTRRALKKFVDEQMQDGDLVAIIRTGAGIGALQQFTTDKRQLYAAIERVRWNPVGSGNIGAFAPLEPKLDTGQPTPEPEAGERTQAGTEREFNDFRSNVFATGTLGAINFVVRGMKDLPGRKSIMLLSDGFKMYNVDASGQRESSPILFALRRLVDAANRASVVIYTMDARGLAITGLTAADSTGGRTVEEVQTELSDRRDQLFDTQDGLRFLAQQTGGLAIVNNNDLSGGIRRILDDQSYYLLGYEPDDETFDPKTRRFNKLVIKVTRPGVRVRYRSGFFGVADEKIEAETRPPSERRLMDALTSPFAVNEISVRLNTLFGSTPASTGYIRSLVHIKAQNLKFEDQPDGGKKLVFDILAYAFGDNGTVVEQIGKTYTFTVRKEAFERLLKNGFVYDFTIPVKKPGAYQLRVAIRDRGSDKVGSANQFVEVPNLKKERLVLSGVVLENLSISDWTLRDRGKPTVALSDPMTDTSLRQFKRGTVLNYGYAILNSKPGSAEGGSLTSLVRLYRDGKMIYEGKPQTIPAAAKTGTAVNASGALVLGLEMLPGDYVMQIVVTDKLAKEKYSSAGQFVQFEIVE